MPSQPQRRASAPPPLPAAPPLREDALDYTQFEADALLRKDKDGDVLAPGLEELLVMAEKMTKGEEACRDDVREMLRCRFEWASGAERGKDAGGDAKKRRERYAELRRDGFETLVGEFGMSSTGVEQSVLEGGPGVWCPDKDPAGAVADWVAQPGHEFATKESSVLLENARFLIVTDIAAQPSCIAKLRSLLMLLSSLVVELTPKGKSEAGAEFGRGFFLVPYEEAFDSRSFFMVLKLEEAGLVTIDIRTQPKVEQRLKFELKMLYLSDGVSKATMAWNAQRELIIDEAYDLVASNLKEEFGQLLLNKSRAACCRDGGVYRWQMEPAAKRIRRESSVTAPQQTPNVPPRHNLFPSKSAAHMYGTTSLTYQTAIEAPASEHSAEATASVDQPLREPPSRSKFPISVVGLHDNSHTRGQEGLKSLPPRRIRFRSDSPTASAQSVPPLLSKVEKNRKGLFVCPNEGCLKTFNSQSGVTYHFESVHRRQDHKPVSSSPPRSASVKFAPPFPGAIKRGDSIFWCPWGGCSKTLTTRAGIRFHYESAHRRKRSREAPVSESPPVSPELTQSAPPRVSKKGPGRFLCPWKGCDKTLTSSQGIKLHHQAFHEGKEYACEKCEKVFRYKSDFRKHRKQCRIKR